MKKLLFSFAVIVIATLGAAVNVGAQNVNEFHISSFDIAYRLSRTDNQQSKLQTTEKITAVFPDYDQNRGLERAIPIEFDEHSLPLKIESVTDDNGVSLQYEERTEGKMRILRIGDPDEYVHGEHTYIIRYTQTGVTKFYEDTRKTEWYWDTNGTEWRVPISKLTISVQFDSDVRSLLATEPRCYQGRLGSKDTCKVNTTATGYSIEVGDLSLYQNVTLAFGFEPDTFAAYEPSFWEKISGFLALWIILSSIIGIVIIFALPITGAQREHRTREIGPVPPQYIPLKDVSVFVAANVVATNVRGSAFSAQLIDFAVRHYIDLVELNKATFMRQPEYEIVIKKPIATLQEEEQEMLVDMFGRVPEVGDRVKLSDLIYNHAYIARASDDNANLTKLVEHIYQLRSQDIETTSYFNRWAVGLLVLGVLLFAPLFLLAALIAWLDGRSLRPLTEKGLEVKRYLVGFENYIKLAEKDRLAFLQGPDTAEKVDVGDAGQLVKLYERALPYAILFGHEKQWSERIGTLYEQIGSVPNWYSGQTAFNAAMFASSVSSFSRSVSYSASASSSSSFGGSMGGGSSGGGGGGGGGGGW